MNWLFLLIGFAIGIIFSLIYLTTRIYGVFRIDRNDLARLRFRLEFTKEPTTINPKTTKIVIFKVEPIKFRELEGKIDETTP